MYIMDDGIRLNASLEKPDGAEGKYPLCIILHGFTGDMEEEQILAAAKAARDEGAASLRVELYGHGRSDGSFRDHTLLKWINNTLAVIDYALSLDFVSKIYLCGHSQGGLTAILAGAIRRDVVAGLILMSPAAMIPEGARAGRAMANFVDPDHFPDEVPAWNGRTLGGNYFRTAQMIHVENYVNLYKGPVLLLHGEADELVPFSVSEHLAGMYPGGTLAGIPKANHCFDGELEPMAAALRKWLREQKA